MCKYYVTWACGHTTVSERKDWSCDVEAHHMDLSATGKPCRSVGCPKCVVNAAVMLVEYTWEQRKHPRKIIKRVIREGRGMGGNTPESR